MQIFMIPGVIISVIIAWIFASFSVIIVAIFAGINKKYKKEYNDLRKPFEKISYMVSIVVYLYLGINLASKGLTGKGIPYFSENYSELYGFSGGGILGIITPQDVFFSIFAFSIIGFIFFLAPRIMNRRWPYKKWSGIKAKAQMATIGSFVLSILIAIVVAWMLPLIVGSNGGMEVTITNVNDTNTSAATEEIWFIIVFALAFIFAFIIYSVYIKKKESVEKDFVDLLFPLSILPAFVIGPLVLAGDSSLKFGNWTGNAVVGLLIISGFLTLAFVAKMFLSGDPHSAIYPLGCALLCSLVAISFSAFVFLFFGKMFADIRNINVLLIPVAFMITILPYELFYERIWRYQFGQWWTTKWRVNLLILSTAILMLVAPLKYGNFKFSAIIIVLLVLFVSPFLAGARWSRRKIIKLPTFCGFVFLKIKPGRVNEVIGNIAKEDGISNPMFITGIYDVVAIMEASDTADLNKKIFSLRNIKYVKAIHLAKDITHTVINLPQEKLLLEEVINE